MNRYPSLATLTLLLALLPLTACEDLTAPELAPGAVSDATVQDAAGAESAALAAAADRFTVYLGAAVQLRGKQRISFDALGNDNRCPIGADCLHRGEVKASFTVYTGSREAQVSFTLPGGSPKPLALHEAPWAYVDGSIVYLVQLDPYPVAESDDGGDPFEKPPIAAQSDPAPAESGHLTDDRIAHDRVIDDRIIDDRIIHISPARATLVVRPCPNTQRRCAGGSGGGSVDA